MKSITYAPVKTWELPDGRVVRFAGSGGRWVEIDGLFCTAAVVRLLAARSPGGAYSLAALRGAMGKERWSRAH